VASDDAGVQDRRALAHWLGEHLAGASEIDVGPLERPASGFSAETLITEVSFTRDSRPATERLVVRKETPDPAIYPPQSPDLDVEVWIQYSIMRALTEHTDVPIAPLLGYEADTSVLGAPFFVMGFVDGDVPIENPIYTQSGFFVDATPEVRRSMLHDGLHVLARVHAIDWRAAGLDWLVAPGTTPSTATQLEIWERSAERELAGRVHPHLDRALEWLHRHEPEPLPPTLCWGDPRPGNMIWRDGRCVCATDFEAASIAPAEVDLGWWLMFDRWSHEVMGADRLVGEPTRDEQRAIYEEHAGRDVGDIFYFEMFAAARYCAIVVRVMNRLVARGDMPADQMIWLENPATDCLLQLLDG
jgi:aminoglycoside phosphotransferase (APT) family kinase protein